MADHGALVLERETQFKDRVRGEVMVSWGVAEAQELGIYELLRDTSGHELPYFLLPIGPELSPPRDMLTTTPRHTPSLAFYHPTMQEVLLQASQDAGAEVRRGAHARQVKPWPLPTVVVEHTGRVKEVSARLVVGVDGRNSLVRKWAGFTVQRGPERLLISGVLFDDMPTPHEEPHEGNEYAYARRS